MKKQPMSRKTLATIAYALKLARDTQVWIYATANTSQGGLGLDSDLAWRYIQHAQSVAHTEHYGNAPAGTFQTEDAVRFQAFQEKTLTTAPMAAPKVVSVFSRVRR